MSNYQINETGQRSRSGTPTPFFNFRLAPRKIHSRLPAPVDIARTQSLRLPASNRPNVFRAVEDSDATLIAEPQLSNPEPSTVEVVQVYQQAPRPALANLSRAATFRFQPTWRARAEREPNKNQETSTDPQPQPKLQLTRSVIQPSVAISHEEEEEFIKLFEERILRKIKNFPSVFLLETKGAQFTPSWNWLSQFRRIVTENSSPEDRMNHAKSFYSNVAKAHQIIEQIRMNFKYGILLDEKTDSSDPNCIVNHFASSKPGKRERMTLDDGSFEYIGDMFQSQLKLEESYAEWHSKVLESPEDRKKRNEVVKQVVKTAIMLKYPAETTHIAVYLIDAFLGSRGGRMTANSWMLLGITALHIAGKLEEPDRASDNRLIRLSGQFYRSEDVYWMEKNVLKELKFDINPPLATTFARLALLGGSLDMPNPNITKLVMDLSQGILYKSLLNSRLFAILPSEKGQAALEIAVEFVFSQYKTYSKRTIKSYNFVTSEPGKTIGDFAVDLCLDTFNQRFITKKLPKVEPSAQFVSSPVRGVRV